MRSKGLIGGQRSAGSHGGARGVTELAACPARCVHGAWRARFGGGGERRADGPGGAAVLARRGKMPESGPGARTRFLEAEGALVSVVDVSVDAPLGAVKDVAGGVRGGAGGATAA